MTTLIKDALIYDGSGGEATTGDILIQGKHITKIGTFTRDYANVCIEARGAIVTPGHIDVSLDTNAHLALLQDTMQPQLLEEGITTIIGGGEGISAAPVFHNSFSVLREHTSQESTNTNWQSLGDFLSYLEKQKVGINVGQYVGYTTLRGGIAHRDRRELTSSEVSALGEVLSQSFREGAFGVSVKLDEGIAPSLSHHELTALGISVAKSDKVLAIHPRDNTHDMYDIVKNIIMIAQNTNANIQVNHLLPLAHVAKDYSALAELLSLKSAISNVHFDVPVHRMHEIPIHTLLPSWAHETRPETTLRRLRDRNVRDRVLNYLTKELAYRKLTICNGAHPQLVSLEGKNIDDIAVSRGTNESVVLLDIMIASSLRATVIDKAIDSVIFQKLIAHAHALFSAAPVGKHPYAQGQLTHFLKQCKENDWCSIGAAVAKMSALPAQKFKITNRGMIRAGYYADIVVMEDFNVRDVFVNGAHVVQKGHAQEIRAGVVLRATKR